MSSKFPALLASIHRDAVRCALADFDDGRDGREPDQREDTLSLALECADLLGFGAHMTPAASQPPRTLTGRGPARGRSRGGRGRRIGRGEHKPAG